MRQIRFAAIAFVSLVAAIASSFIDPGTFFHRTLSFTLCSVLGFTSNFCYGNLARNAGDRAVAALPPTEQTQNIFPALDFSPYFQSTRPEFEQTDSLTRPAIQSQSENYPFTGMWFYAMYESPSSTKPFYSNLMQVSHSGNDYIPSLCEGNCDVRNLRLTTSRHIPTEQSLAVDNESLSVEIVGSTDRETIWGQILDRETKQTVYFIMMKLVPQTTTKSTKELPKLKKISSIKNSTYRLLTFYFPPSYKYSTTDISRILVSRWWKPINTVYRGFLKPIGTNVNELITNSQKPDAIGLYDTFTQSIPDQELPETLRNSKPSNRVNPVDTFNSTGNNQGRQNQQRRNQSQGQSGNYQLDSSRETVEQGSSWAEQIKKNAGNWFKTIFGPMLNSVFPNLSKADTEPNNDGSNSGDSRNQRQPFPEPSPEQPDRNPNNRKPQPMAPPPPLQPGECLCKWSMNTNRAITRDGVPTVETYDYVTGCNRSAEEVREILRRQGIGTSLPDGTEVNGQTVGEVRRVTSPGDIPGNGCEEDKPKPQPQNGETWGDPHLVTFDRLKYDHHAVGEFILVKSTDGTFEIQVREAAVPASSQVALNTAAAMKVGNTRVAFYVKDFPDSDTTNPLRVDGKPIVIQGGSLSLPGGGTITQVNQGSYIVEWTTGERVGVKVDNFGSSALLDINPALPQTQQGQLIGLLGNFNGNPDDDLKSRDGKVLPPQSTINQVSQITQNLTNWVPIPLNQVESLFLEQLHKQFGDSWRISQQESLFDYAPGKNTESYTNRAFPNGFQVLRMLLPAQVQAAEAACRQAGVPSERLEGCLFDVGVTGNADFAKVAANALTNIVRDRVEQQIRDRVPVPGGIKIPGIRF